VGLPRDRGLCECISHGPGHSVSISTLIIPRKDITYRKHTARNSPDIFRCLGRGVSALSSADVNSNGQLTIRHMVVSFLSPSRKTAMAIDPIIPSRFSMKNPGCTMLDETNQDPRHVGLARWHHSHPIETLLRQAPAVLLDCLLRQARVLRRMARIRRWLQRARVDKCLDLEFQCQIGQHLRPKWSSGQHVRQKSSHEGHT